MNIKDYKQNNDIKFVISVLDNELISMKHNRDNGHWLSPQYERIQNNINLLESGIKKIKDKWNF